MAAHPIVIADRVSRLVPTAVNSILAEVRQLQAQGRDLVSLMRGEPDFKTAPHITLAAAEAMSRGRTGYPDNRREAVAAKLARENGLSYSPGTEILANSGATFGIYAALAALLNEGDQVLVPDPVYDAYQSPVRLAGGEVVRVRSAIVEGRFTLPAEAIEQAITPRSKVLLLNTPWNPTGTVFTRAELEAIAAVALRHNLVLLSDEIYEAITYGEAKHVSPAVVVPELRERCVLVNSLSKTYAMTGWRVGYTAAPEAITKAMLLVLQQSSRGPATFIQDAAAAALNGPQDCVREMHAEYSRRRALLLDKLDGIAGVRVLEPEGGFFAMLDVRAKGVPSNGIRKRLLEESGVVVVHGAAYGAGGEGTLRVSFASGGEVLLTGLACLRQGLEAIG
jgi:aspartate aminotransferase